jgi:GT2 family glycosyltransferase
MTLTAIVPATDRPATLARCVGAVTSALEPPEELLVIDGPKGGGPAAARNEGVSRATGDIVVFVDADVEVHPDAFVRIRRAFERDADLAAIFGSYDDDPQRNGVVSDFRNLLHHHVHHSGAGQASTFWAGLGAIRRESFLAIGGFDVERFPRPSVEDIDLGMRLARQGGRIVLDPRIQGKHLKRWSLRGMIQTDLLRRGVPWLRLLLENDSSSAALNLSPRNRASAAASVTLLLALVTRRPKLAGAAFLTLLSLNARFYLLLLSKRGINQAATGLPLHVLHHLVSVAAVPIALLEHFSTRTRGNSAR